MVSIPAPHHSTSIKADEYFENLSPYKVNMFHNLVSKTIKNTKREIPDTCAALAFLTTRVREPNKDDYSKLVHLMKYIRATRNIPLILSASVTGVLKLWIDASYAVHPIIQGHTCGSLSMGRGFTIVTSTKQKLNTRSSTE